MAVGDAEKRPTRWQRAWRDWPGLNWSDLVPGTIGLGIAVLVLAESDFPGSTVVEVGIVGGSAMAAVLLWALLQLWWAWLQAPMRMLTEDLIAIRERVEVQQQPGPAVPVPRLSVRTEILWHVNRGRSLLQQQWVGLDDARTWTEDAAAFLEKRVGADVAGAFLEIGASASGPDPEVEARVEYLVALADELKEGG